MIKFWMDIVGGGKAEILSVIVIFYFYFLLILLKSFTLLILLLFLFLFCHSLSVALLVSFLAEMSLFLASCEMLALLLRFLSLLPPVDFLSCFCFSTRRKFWVWNRNWWRFGLNCRRLTVDHASTQRPVPSRWCKIGNNVWKRVKNGCENNRQKKTTKWRQ